MHYHYIGKIWKDTLTLPYTDRNRRDGNNTSGRAEATKSPRAKKEEVNRVIQDMELHEYKDFLVVLVNDEDGSTSFCLYYRQLNDVTRNVTKCNRYPRHVG